MILLTVLQSHRMQGAELRAPDQDLPAADGCEDAHPVNAAGCLIGAAGPAGYSGWQGMAPGAKIAFQDLGTGTNGSIDAPDDLAREYFSYTYTM